MNSEQLKLFKLISTVLCFTGASLYGLTDLEPPQYKMAGLIYRHFGKHAFVGFLLVMGTLFLVWFVNDLGKKNDT